MEILNSINKGQFRDADPNYQPQGFFYESINGRVISKANGNYSWENIKGNSISFSITAGYSYLGHAKLRNRLVVFSTNGTNSEIGTVLINNVTLIGVYTIQYNDSTVAGSLNFSVDHPINEAFGFYENSQIQRIYFSDNFNPPRAVNIPQGGILVPPPAEIFDWSPLTQPPIINYYKTINGGNTYCGKYVFLCRFLTNDGATTDYFSFSNLVHVKPSSGPGDLTIYNATEGDSSDVISNRSIVLNFENIDTNFDKIEIVSFFSNEQNQITTGTLVCRDNIVGTTYQFTFTGSENLAEITIDDVLTTTITFETVKTLTQIYYNNIPANFTERLELDEVITADVKCEIYELVNDGRTLEGGISVDFITNPPLDTVGHNSYASATGTPAAGIIYAGQWYRVTGDNTTYNGTSYGPTAAAGEYFQGTTAAGAVVTTHTPDSAATIVTPYLRIKQYWNRITSAYEYKNIPILDEYLDYKSEAVDYYARAYWGYETYRIGLEPYDLQGKKMSVKWLGDIAIPRRHGIAALGDGYDTNNANGRVVLSASMIENYDLSATNGYHQTNIKAMSLVINNLDITDIKDKISGFSIVRAKRDKQILSEGILFPTYYLIAAPLSTRNFPGYTISTILGTAKRRQRTYTYYSPEHNFEIRNTGQHQAGNKLEILHYLNPDIVNQFGGSWYDEYSNELVGDPASTEYHFISKLYNIVNKRAGAPAYQDIGTSQLINTIKTCSFAAPGILYDPGNPDYVFWNDAVANTGGGPDSKTYGAKCRIIKLEDEDVGTGPNYWDGGMADAESSAALPYITYVAERNPKSVLYGGTGINALANTDYFSTGHYQPINATVLANIYNAGTGKWVFDDIQVFGGDAYIHCMDIQRFLHDAVTDAPDYYSSCLVFPVQSEVNIALREGNHSSQVRVRHVDLGSGAPVSALGLRADAGDERLEEWGYNPAYSTDDVGEVIPGYDEESLNIGEYDHRARYSEQKTPGELIDNFRRFLVNNYIDVSGDMGPINNIRSKSNRLWYWQDDVFGYIPFRERETINGALGDAIQLGIGGKMERYDEISNKFYGNQHQKSLVETDSGFAWMDWKRKAIINFNISKGLTEESILKGLYQYLRNEVNLNVGEYDIPNKGPWTAGANFIIGGIMSGFDPVYRQVYMSLYYNNGSGGVDFKKTIIFDELTNSFNGSFDYYPLDYINFNNKLISPKQNATTFYIADTNDYGNLFGTIYNSKLVIIVTGNEQNIERVYDLIRVKGNDKIFNSIRFYNSYQDVTETITDATGVIINRNYSYRNRKFIGNIPLESRARFRDNYLILEFNMNNVRNELIKFVNLITTYRKTW